MMDYPPFTAIFEIIVLWFIFYQTYRAFKDSRGAAILIGLIGLLIVGSILLELFQATVLKNLAGSMIGIGTILAILFQPELRTALAKIGTQQILRHLWNRGQDDTINEEVIDAVRYLVSKRYGALLVFCRNNKLSNFSNTGVQIDAVFSRELIGTIFQPKTLLHDGAVIIDNNRILSAASILPVSNKELKDRSMGLRHRAGIGLAEESDAIVVIVSEETGAIALAVGNMVERNVDSAYLKTRLNELLFNNNNDETA